MLIEYIGMSWQCRGKMNRKNKNEPVTNCHLMTQTKTSAGQTVTIEYPFTIDNVEQNEQEELDYKMWKLCEENKPVSYIYWWS